MKKKTSVNTKTHTTTHHKYNYNKSGSNYKLSWLIFIILSLMFVYNSYVENNHKFISFDTRWYVCLDIVKAGELYKGNQYCEQGPIVFYAGYIHSLLFGPPYEQPFNISITFVSLILIAITFWILLKIMAAEGMERFAILAAILYPIFMIKYAILKYEMTLSLFPLILGFYVLYYWKQFPVNDSANNEPSSRKLSAMNYIANYSGIISGFLFGLSFLAKATNVFVIALIWLYYLFTKAISIDNKTGHKISSTTRNTVENSADSVISNAADITADNANAADIANDIGAEITGAENTVESTFENTNKSFTKEPDTAATAAASDSGSDSGKLKIDKRFFAILFSSIAVACILVFAVWLLFPNMLIYSMLIQANAPNKIGVAEILRRLLFSGYVRKYVFYTYVVAAAYAFYKQKSIFHLIGVAASIPIIISLSSTAWDTIIYLTNNYYLLGVYPFITVSICLMAKQISESGLEIHAHKKRFFTGIFVIGFIFFFIYPSYFDTPWFKAIDSIALREDNAKKEELTQLVEGVIALVPNQEPVLWEYNSREELESYIKKRGFQTPISSIEVPRTDLIGEGIFRDPLLVEPLKKLLGPQYVEWEVKHPERILQIQGYYNEFIDKILAGQYSLIVFGPPAWAATIEMFNSKKVQESKVLDGYCKVSIPDMTYYHHGGQHHRILFFKDRDQCQAFARSMIDYYLANYGPICFKDEWVANSVVANSLAMNGIKIDACPSGAVLVPDYAEALPVRQNKIQAVFVFSLLGAYLICFCGFYALTRRKNG